VSPPFECVAVACRGEIAVRIIRACRELGVRSLALVAADERGAIAEREADAVAEVASYLDAATLAITAAAGGAQALHPGYGFLSESPDLAEACRAAGLAFVGAPAEALATLGRKDAARELAQRAGVPVVPGGANADDVGYPVLVKARAGGGGRGMRVVREPGELAAAIEAAGREAVAAFGDGGLVYERYVEGARHVEVQILCDTHGAGIHLGERDCSVQRRYQKLIEETPAVGLSQRLLDELREAGVRFARRLKYRGAGTVEFLVDTDRDRFYFLEMNSRIQVEHPVTEAVTGIDLVAEQIAIANGEGLRFGQADVTLRGHAIECRINAEDPAEDFRPSPGRVRFAAWPSGEGIRVDTHIESGSAVPPFYDSLLGKIIVHGTDRVAALALLERALVATRIDGVATNCAFHQRVLANGEFRHGGVDTGFVARLGAAD
jgi:acetyl-CoA carboxylase biotin carboxylase subunit